MEIVLVSCTASKEGIKVDYDKRNSSSYVDAAISCMGITDETLIKGCAFRFLSILKNEKQLLVHSRNCSNTACKLYFKRVDIFV